MNQYIKLSFFILQLIFATNLLAQFPAELLFSYEIEDRIHKTTLRSTSASYFYTMIGAYGNATNTYDIPVSWGVDSLEIDYHKTAPALEKIVALAKDKRIVIISESHLKPQHRIFSKKVIKQLAQHGFTHLGLEALATKPGNPVAAIDSNLNNRAYLLETFRAGFYLQEPQFAALVRNSLASGYQLFGYERAVKIKGKDRDEIQADNVIAYMEKHKVEKLILHCGWHHAIESDRVKRGTARFLANYLKEKTGLDPLTIYQDNFTEKVDENEHPILATLNLSEPSVFVDAKGEIIRISEEVDIEVIHPKTHYRDGRPNWYYESEKHQSYLVNQDSLTLGFPVFAKAYLLEEDGGMPVDVIELRHLWDNKRLVLKRGKYRLVLDSKEEEKSWLIDVE